MAPSDRSDDTPRISPSPEPDPASERASWDDLLLPGIDTAGVQAALNAGPGQLRAAEIPARLAEPDSSAALTVNAFGWFLGRTEALPAFPALARHWPVTGLALDEQLPLPWQGGRHPRAGVLLRTPSMLIGVASNRYEPYLKKLPGGFGEAFGQRVWGHQMLGYCRLRDGLQSGRIGYRMLDGTRLVKAAFGLRTAVHRRDGPHHGLRPVLLYLYAEPRLWVDGSRVDPVHKSMHRAEIADFSSRVVGDEVPFLPVSYARMLTGWADNGGPDLANHVAALTARFDI